MSTTKTIAKNTLFLYFRMFLIMGVSLFSSSVVLNVLGVEDFGVYNVVGGIVVLFSFINVAMSVATQRFLNYALGHNDLNEVKRIFNMSMTVHLSIVLLIIFLAETIGLWFLNTQMNIPIGKMEVANWVYQCSILTACIGVIQVPYNASVIAYEKMSFFAYIGIAEVVLKLIAIFLVVFSSFDKLKTYSALIFFVSLSVFLLYKLYCNRKIEITAYCFFWDSNLYRQLMSFSGWSLFGSIATVSANQGVNILLNIFYGVVINAAMGISNQVNGALNSFVTSFQTAFNPQIVKLYAAQEHEKLETLILRTAKLSFLVLFALVFPVMLNIDFLLKIWLKTVPEYTAAFCNIALACSLIEALSAPLWMTVQATGKIKKYQILISFVLGLNIVLSYIFLKMGFDPEIIMEIRLLIYTLCLIIRILFIHSIGIIKFTYFINDVLLRVLCIVVITAPLPYMIHKYYTQWKGLIVTSFPFMLLMIFAVYIIGLTKSEKKMVKAFVMDRVKFKH